MDELNWYTYVANCPSALFDSTGLSADRKQCENYLRNATGQAFEAIHHCIRGASIKSQCNAAGNSLQQFEHRECRKFKDLNV